MAKRKAPRSGTKVALIGKMLRRKNGCSALEVSKATGWPTVSIPLMAKMNGLKFTKERKPGGLTRYRAV